MKASLVWSKSKPLVDLAGSTISQSHTAMRFLKNKGFTAINPYILRNFRFWKELSKKGDHLDLDGYFLALAKDITGFPIGFQSVPITENGRVSQKGLTRCSQFAPGDLLNSAIRILDTPDRSHLHMTADVMSGLAVSIMTGKRTWASPLAMGMEYMEIPPGISNVWVWKAPGLQAKDGLDESVSCEILVQRLIDAGYETVHVMDLDPSAGLSWGEAFEKLELSAGDSRIEMFNKCCAISTYSQVTSFGYTKIA